MIPDTSCLYCNSTCAGVLPDVSISSSDTNSVEYSKGNAASTAAVLEKRSNPSMYQRWFSMLRSPTRSCGESEARAGISATTRSSSVDMLVTKSQNRPSESTVGNPCSTPNLKPSTAYKVRLSPEWTGAGKYEGCTVSKLSLPHSPKQFGQRLGSRNRLLTREPTTEIRGGDPA